MSETRQRQLIIVSMLVTSSLVYIDNVFEHGDFIPGREIIGTAVAFTMCSIMVDLGWDLGGAFAVLIMASAFMLNSKTTLDLIKTLLSV